METKESNIWKQLKDRKRIVVKIGSSSLTHKTTGDLNFTKLEKLVRELCDLRNQGKDVVLVSSGAIAVGRKAIGLKDKPTQVAMKQACAAIGQSRLLMTYQKIFAEYNQIIGQVLMTKDTMLDNVARKNAQNTFEQLLEVGAIPIVNENDTVSTYEMQFGDNDQLSAIVASLIGADLLILLSDIDGLYTDDPRENKHAKFIEIIEKIDDDLLEMGKETTGSDVGTGGMSAKLTAAKIATLSGADMIIANGKDVRVIHRMIEGRKGGSLFLANKDEDFYIADFIEESMN